MRADACSRLLVILLAAVIGSSSCKPLKTEAPVRDANVPGVPEISVTPQGDGVPFTAQIVLSFASGLPPDVLAADQQTLRLPLLLTPDPGCSWRKLDARRIACELNAAARLRLATEYRLTVQPGWRTAAGQQVTEEFRHSFRTAAPAIVFASLWGHATPTQPRFGVFTPVAVRAESLIGALRIIAENGTVFPVRRVAAGEPLLEAGNRSINYSVPYESFERASNELEEDPRFHLLGPAQPLPPGRYRLEVAPGLLPSEGDVAGTEQRVLQAFESYGDFALRGVYCRPEGGTTRVLYESRSGTRCERGSVQLHFSSAVESDALNESTRVTGPGFVQGYLRSAQESYRPDEQFPGSAELRWSLYELAGGASLRLQIASLRDRFERKLPGPIDVDIQFAAQPSSLQVPYGLVVFENDSDSDLSVTSVNADEPLQLQWRDMSGREQQVILPPEARPNDLLHVRRVRESPAVLPNDAWIRGSSGSQPDRVDGFLAVRTDFNVQWIGGLDSGLVWVTTLSTAQPVAGATVELFRGELGRGESERLARAVTDGNGLARIDYQWPADSREGKVEQYLAVTLGERRSWLPWIDYGSSDCSACDPAFPRQRRTQRALVFASQPVYDPGERVDGVLVGRMLDASSNRPLRGRHWLEFLDGDRLIAGLRVPVLWSEFGTSRFSVMLPEDIRSSSVNLRLVEEAGRSPPIPAGSLPVAAVQKPLYKVFSQARPSRAGATIEVAAELFAGGPFVGAPAEVITRVTPGYLDGMYERHAGFEFAFVAPDRGYTTQVPMTKGSTDAEGRFQHEITIDPKRYYIAQLEYEALIEDPSGRRLATRGRQRVFVHDRFIGVASAPGPLEAGGSAAVRVVVVDAQGRNVPDVPARLEIAFNAAGTLAPQEGAWRTVRICNLRTGTQPVSCSFEPAMSGYYRVTGSIRSSQGRAQRMEQTRFLEVTPRGSLPLRHRSDEVKLVAPRTVYVGDTMEVDLTADFERSTALVTLLTNRVMDAQVHTLSRGSKRLSIPITRDLFPGFVVEAAVQVPRRGHLTPDALRRAGADTLRPQLQRVSQRVYVRERGAPELLQLTPDRRAYAPGETGTLELLNKDSKASIEVSLAVMDSSLLALMATNGPYAKPIYEIDPLLLAAPADWLLPARRESLLTYTLRGDQAYGLLPLAFSPASPYPAVGEVPFITGGPGFGSNAELSAGWLRQRRSRFSDVALWRAQLVLGPGEVARVPVEFPDNVGEWTIVAMAVDAGHRVHTVREQVTVTQPLLVAPLLPAQLVVGDALDAQFSVTNRTSEPVQASWQRVISDVLQDRGSETPLLTLEPNRPATVSLPVVAGRAGVAHIVVGAVAGDIQDGIEVELPIQSAEVSGTQVTAGKLQARQAIPLTLALPADATPGSGSVAVQVGRGGIDLIANAIAAARDYPHQCWEQSLTRVVGAGLYLELGKLSDPGFAWPNAQELTLAMPALARRFQAEDGGMRFFESGSWRSDPYLTAYTVVAFDWLRGLDVGIPTEVEQRAIDFLLDLDRTSPQRLREWAVALPILVQRQQIDAARLERMVAAVPTSDVVTRSHLYAAVLRVVDPERRARLLAPLTRELTQQLYFDPGTASLPLVSGEVAQCTVAINLLASKTSAALGGRIDELLRGVEERASRRNRWGTTHENIFCAKALWDYQRSAPRANRASPLDVAVALNGRALGTVSLRGTGSQLQVLTGSLAAGPQRLELQPAGQGAADYRVVLNYQRPLPASSAQASGLSLARSYQVWRAGQWIEVGPQTRVQKSDLLRVNLDVVAPTARALVVLQDPLPAGVEVLNDVFATTSRTDLAKLQDGGPQYFNTRAVRRDNVSYYAEGLPAGRHRVSYLVRAIAAGEFTALPPRIEEMYRPEIFGTAGAFRLKIVGPEK